MVLEAHRGEGTKIGRIRCRLLSQPIAQSLPEPRSNF